MIKIAHNITRFFQNQMVLKFFTWVLHFFAFDSSLVGHNASKVENRCSMNHRAFKMEFTFDYSLVGRYASKVENLCSYEP